MLWDMLLEILWFFLEEKIMFIRGFYDDDDWLWISLFVLEFYL